MTPYQTRSSDIVKSVRQRWLLNYWLRLRRGRSLPEWSGLDMAELESCFDDLTILDVLATSAGHRFRIFNHGKNVGAMFAGECAGKFLDDVLPPAARNYTLETYEQVVRLRLPVYTVSKFSDADERTVLYERLLLPFAIGDQSAARIIGFLETISPDGAFERRDLMLDAPTRGEFVIKAVLQVRADVAPV